MHASLPQSEIVPPRSAPRNCPCPARLEQQNSGKMITRLYSAERRLVEGAQLARMQRLPAHAQEIERLEADLEVLSHRALVEGVGGARQLDLAVQRLVGDAQQRAIGHPQPVAVGGDRAALHVDRNRTGEVDAAPLLGVAQLPVA